MYTVRYDETVRKWVVWHARFGTYPLAFPSEAMASHQAWCLNMAPEALTS